MRVFLRKIGLFILFTACALTLVGTFLLAFTDRDRDFELAQDVTSLYIGDSRMELAINDTLLEHSKNCGAQSESFYYSYFKLKKLLENNRFIRRVYLSIGHHSVSAYYDRFVDGNFSASVAPNYIGILPADQQSRILKANAESAFKFSRNFVQQGFKKLLSIDKAGSTGAFNNPFRDSKAMMASMDKRLQFQFYTNQHLNACSDETRFYLKQIAQLCAAQNIELIAISLPVHPYYLERIPKEYHEAFKNVIAENQLKFIDLSKLPMSDDCFAPDGDHLSAKGAGLTTLGLKELIVTEISNGCQ